MENIYAIVCRLAVLVAPGLVKVTASTADVVVIVKAPPGPNTLGAPATDSASMAGTTRPVAATFAVVLIEAV